MGGPEGDPEGADPDAALLEGEFQSLMGLSVDDILAEGRKVLFARLVGKVRLGLANHQELAILRNILKDNGLTLGLTQDRVVAPASDPLVDGRPLPDFGEDGGQYFN